MRPIFVNLGASDGKTLLLNLCTISEVRFRADVEGVIVNGEASIVGGLDPVKLDAAQARLLSLELASFTRPHQGDDRPEDDPLDPVCILGARAMIVQ